MSELERYIDMMSSVHGLTKWEVGWESLPKYIGHKIFNTETSESVLVVWDKGYPEMMKENGKRDFFHCHDFRHDKALWIYKVGEHYC